MTRRLVLRSETLAELANDELALVNGAGTPSGVACPTGVTWCAAICDFVGRVREEVTKDIADTTLCV